MGKVLKIANALSAEISQTDLSIAHRLPSKGNGLIPILHCSILQKSGQNKYPQEKEIYGSKLKLKNVRIFEDLPIPRVSFFHMMKKVDRIADVWTRDGVINYIWKADGLKYKIHILYHGGGFLKYNMMC